MSTNYVEVCSKYVGFQKTCAFTCKNQNLHDLKVYKVDMVEILKKTTLLSDESIYF